MDSILSLGLYKVKMNVATCLSTDKSTTNSLTDGSLLLDTSFPIVRLEYLQSLQGVIT